MHRLTLIYVNLITESIFVRFNNCLLYGLDTIINIIHSVVPWFLEISETLDFYKSSQYNNYSG